MTPARSLLVSLFIAMAAWNMPGQAHSANGSTTVLRTVYQLWDNGFPGGDIVAVAEDQDLRAIAEDFGRRGAALYIQVVEDRESPVDSQSSRETFTTEILHANGEVLTGVTIDTYPRRHVRIYSRSFALHQGLIRL